MFPEYSHCTLCPHACGVDRNKGKTGFCQADGELHIASVCVHKGEEPAIMGTGGICNVFFSHCNLQCIFCQNYQISRNTGGFKDSIVRLEEAVEIIIKILDQGCQSLGFVSPTHFLPHVKAIIQALHERNYFPVTVYNTNAYDNPLELRSMEGLIDIYLPDFKYSDPEKAAQWSGAADYPEAARKAILEMFRQKGATLRMRNETLAESGMIIRHMVMPGCADESIEILEWLAEHCSPRLHLSLMSQYAPTAHVRDHSPLNRCLLEEEYRKVVDAAEKLGFTRGWTQEFSSAAHYLPDFEKEQPFED